MSRGGGDRGGRGGGRGGGGLGRNSVFTPQLLGGIAFNDIVAVSKEGTGILYPDMPTLDTDFPSEKEAKIARRYNTMAAEMKFTSCWIEVPVKASTDIEKWSDRFKTNRVSNDGSPIMNLADLHARRKFDKDLLPTAAFEAVFERKKRRAGAEGRSKAKKMRSVKDFGDADDDMEAGKEEGSESEPEELEELDDEEEWEDENDYADNYFDNGEDDGGDGDALGGGGDEDGGVFD
ncbi:hypothetical protein MNV49_004214 [Pseudohyphozyma bogoriensis]|nr:hypothetical protein MNV49_004214 [Pseudohyphozyma bogoriensis]